jgi:hypothetical protein
MNSFAQRNRDADWAAEETAKLCQCIMAGNKSIAPVQLYCMTTEKQLTAIIYCSIPQPVTGNQFLKFRNISNNNISKSKFLDFAAKFNGAEYVNFYGKQSKKFIERIYLK